MAHSVTTDNVTTDNITAHSVTTDSVISRVYRPGSASTVTFSGQPGAAATAVPSSHRSWKDPEMPTTTKPEPVEDEREQARRALQRSMDTRQ
jgi:hypothetical protein